MSIRARVVLTTASAAAVVVVLATALIVALAVADRRHDLDQQLSREAALAGAALTGTAGLAFPAELFSRPGAPGRAVRLLDNGGRELVRRGAVLPAPPGVDGVAGERAETVPGPDADPWRVVTRPVPDAQPAQFVQVAAPAAEVDERIARLLGLAAVLGTAATAGAAMLGSIIGGLAVRRINRLRRTADAVAESGDPSLRVETADLPAELAELAERMNGMLHRLAQARADQERTLATSRAFAAQLAHEVRTPLSSMSANLQVLGTEKLLPTQQEILADIVAEQQRMASVVEALHALTAAELADSPTERVDLGDLVELIAARVRKRHRHLRVLAKLPEQTFEVDGSADGLAVVVENLLENTALHGRPEGGPVTARVSAHIDGGGWTLVVDDDGQGVPAADRGRVLAQFQRGDTTAAGVGLGLAIVAAQVRWHGGDVVLQDSELGGLRVLVTVPGHPRHTSDRRPP